MQQLLGALLVLATSIVAQEIDASSDETLTSTSFSSCGDDSLTNRFTPTAFNVSLTPSNKTLSYTLSGHNTFAGNDTIEVDIESGDVTAYRSFVDPCSVTGLADLCPSFEGDVDLRGLEQSSGNAVDFLDGKVLGDLVVRVRLNGTTVGGPDGVFGCVEARFGMEAEGNGTDSDNGTMAGDSGMNGTSDGDNSTGNSSGTSGGRDQSGAAGPQLLGTGMIVATMLIALMISGDVLA